MTWWRAAGANPLVSEVAATKQTYQGQTLKTLKFQTSRSNCLCYTSPLFQTGWHITKFFFTSLYFFFTQSARSSPASVHRHEVNMNWARQTRPDCRPRVPCRVRNSNSKPHARCLPPASMDGVNSRATQLKTDLEILVTLAWLRLLCCHTIPRIFFVTNRAARRIQRNHVCLEKVDFLPPQLNNKWDCKIVSNRSEKTEVLPWPSSY